MAGRVDLAGGRGGRGHVDGEAGLLQVPQQGGDHRLRLDRDEDAPGHRLGQCIIPGNVAPARIALAQIDPTVGDFDGNAALIRRAAERARAAGASLVIFPELALCGYPPRDLLDLPEFLDRAARHAGRRWPSRPTGRAASRCWSASPSGSPARRRPG